MTQKSPLEKFPDGISQRVNNKMNTTQTKHTPARNGGKYCIIGSETQVAATETRHCNLSLARKVFRPARFSNGCKALVVMQANTRAEAERLLNRSNSALAFISGRLGRWLAPTFVVIETARLRQ